MSDINKIEGFLQVAERALDSMQFSFNEDKNNNYCKIAYEAVVKAMSEIKPDNLSHYVKSDLDGGNRTIICRCKRVPKLVFINNIIEKYHCEYCDLDFEIKRIK